MRWTVCALLFFATTINYVDRQVLSLLAKTLETKIGWNDIEYSNITTAFTAAYAIGMLGVGRLLDRYGTRVGFALAVAVWSAAAMAHAAATTAFTFGIARAFLGLGEAANFPASIKTVAEWFPRKERAQATGIFNSGSNVGATAAILAVPYLTLRFGWPAAFVATGALGFVWLAFWLAIYARPEEHRKISAQELGYVQADPPDKAQSYPWAPLLRHKETWAFSAGKFLTDGIWWFYLFWLPKYLQETFGLTISQIIVPTLIAYNGASVGSVAGGWLSSGLLKRGWNLNASRKLAMLICALAVVPVIYAPYSRSMWLVVGLVTLALAAHQGWSANLFTTASDMFPRAAVGSVVGIGGMAGALGGVLVQKATGYIVTWTHSYLPMFITAGSIYVLALAVVHALAPKLTAAELD
ncbi:MAG: MFS transporter [Acidobacteriia bacterium]|nr:MFS transporter [Terriglobia bacterium]